MLVSCLFALGLLLILLLLCFTLRVLFLQTTVPPAPLPSGFQLNFVFLSLPHSLSLFFLPPSLPQAVSQQWLNHLSGPQSLPGDPSSWAAALPPPLGPSSPGLVVTSCRCQACVCLTSPWLLFQPSNIF